MKQMENRVDQKRSMKGLTNMATNLFKLQFVNVLMVHLFKNAL